MAEKEYEYKPVFVYKCWRNKPECRHEWESLVELKPNTVQCPQCGSCNVTFKTENRRFEKKAVEKK